MTPKQLMMADGAPKALFMTPDQRRKAWQGVALRIIPLFQDKPRDESPETQAFRAQEDERRRLKSLQSIARMKNRFATKAMDYGKMRWDPRKGKFVEDAGTKVASTTREGMLIERLETRQPPTKANTKEAKDLLWSRVTKDNARTLGELNGVWDAKYEKLSGGLLIMTVTNRLKGLVKKGEVVTWK